MTRLRCYWTVTSNITRHSSHYVPCYGQQHCPRRMKHNQNLWHTQDWNRIQIDDSLWMPKWSCKFISNLLSCCCKRSHLEKAATRIPGCVLWIETAFVLSHATERERAAWLFTARLELPISSAKFIGERGERLPPTWNCFPSNILWGGAYPTRCYLQTLTLLQTWAEVFTQT